MIHLHKRAVDARDKQLPEFFVVQLWTSSFHDQHGFDIFLDIAKTVFFRLGLQARMDRNADIYLQRRHF